MHRRIYVYPFYVFLQNLYFFSNINIAIFISNLVIYILVIYIVYI